MSTPLTDATGREIREGDLLRVEEEAAAASEGGASSVNA